MSRFAVLKKPVFKKSGQSDSEVPPTKEDISDTLDQFGGFTDLENENPSETDSSRRNEINNTDQPPSPSFSNSYCEEWKRLFDGNDYIRNLRSLGMDGMLRSCRFRSICWRVYTDVLPEDRKQWVTKMQENRKMYSDLKKQMIVNPHLQPNVVNLACNNPLSQEDESPWNQYFQDNELRLTIKQDVIRTFPELEFFQSSTLRHRMVDMLFCFARKNGHLCYKQGMHELLAPLIFVLHCDHQAFLHACELELVEGDVTDLLDPQYLEHDAYAMFCQVMDSVEPWYQAREISPPSKLEALATVQPFARPQDMQPSNVIVNKLTRIQDYVLKKHDLELHMHMERLDIAPQIYGIRWLRLLFGREFPMQDLLVVWDAIFADGISFDLVDYIFVAMLLYIRDILLSSDYPTCLGILMRFPPVGDVHYLIDRALYLRDPHIYPRPPNYTYQKVSNLRKKNKRQNSFNVDQVAHKLKTSTLSGFNSLSRKISSSSGRPHSLHLKSSSGALPKSTSEPMSLLTDHSPGSRSLPRHFHRRQGSSSSLPQVEQSSSLAAAEQASGMKAGVSSSSLARLETLSNSRTPDSNGSSWWQEQQYMSSSTHKIEQFSQEGVISSQKNSKYTPQNQKPEFYSVPDTAFLQIRLNDVEAMCRYCASKMDIHIDKLQHDVLHQPNLLNEDEIFIALAGLKQVRDILKGTLKFSNNMLDSDPDVCNNVNNYETGASLPKNNASLPVSNAQQTQPTLSQFYINLDSGSNTPTEPEAASGFDMNLEINNMTSRIQALTSAESGDSD